MRSIYSVEGALLEALAEHLDNHGLGDMPNLEMPTMGGEYCWDTVQEVNGLRLQVNKFFGNARILDQYNIRRAWGSRSAMEEKLRRMTSDEFLQPGDIIGIKRKAGVYEHYAVYIGNDKVIHYAAENGDFTGDNITIHEAPISEFLREDCAFFVVNFPDRNGRFEKIYQQGSEFFSRVSDFGDLQQMMNHPDYHLYTPEETIERAKSRLGEKNYSLEGNNCEHFAFWCKTGISDSHQVNKVMNAVETICDVLENADNH